MTEKKQGPSPVGGDTREQEGDEVESKKERRVLIESAPTQWLAGLAELSPRISVFAIQQLGTADYRCILAFRMFS